MPAIIPVHDLAIKELRHADFDIIELNGEGPRNYDGVEPHRHNFFELLVFNTAGGIHEVDFEEHAIQARSLHFVSPSQVHKLKANTSKGSVLCFSPDFVYRKGQSQEGFHAAFPFYDFNRAAAFITIDAALFNELSTLIESIRREFGSGQLYRHDIIRAYLEIILLKIKEQYLHNEQASPQRNKAGHQQIVAFKTLVDRHYTEHLGVADYASRLNVSPNHLNSICKKETGKTAIQLIHERLLLEARRLLYSTNLSIKEIAFGLHFEDVAYFTRFFKKNLQVTPLEYRQRMQ